MGRKKILSKSIVSHSNDAATDKGEFNRPRNLLVTDATTLFSFSFRGRFAILTNFTVNQTPDEETWPGGALWDLGVVLAQVFVVLGTHHKIGHTEVTLTTTDRNNGKLKGIKRSVQLPPRLMESSCIKSAVDSPSIILELGCGVGLTGLVAASALEAKLAVLTDLRVVVDNVTRPNVEICSKSTGHQYRTISKEQVKVVATPLCWGDPEDTLSVLELLKELDIVPKAKSSRRKNGVGVESEKSTHFHGMPDIVIIGDVAYQHTPGAPSHFEALLSTLLTFSTEKTVVVFGTRLRMPASVDLLELFLQHFEEIIEPVRADEVDALFGACKHNMTVHFLKRKIS